MATYDTAMDLTGDPSPPPPNPQRVVQSVQETVETEHDTTPAARHVDTPVGVVRNESQRRGDSSTPTPMAPPNGTASAPKPAPALAPAAEPAPSAASRASLDRTIDLATGRSPITKTTPLHEIPELADRYVPITSTAQSVEFRNAHKFCLKPPFWNSWTSEQYLKLGHWLESLDLTEIARTLNKPVQEIGCMLSNVAIVPLCDATEASRRGVDGMNKWFETYGEYGAPTREWTAKKVRGEVSEVAHGVVYLVLENGNKLELSKSNLSEEDKAWLKQNLSGAHKKTFFEGSDEGSKGSESGELYHDWTAEKVTALFTAVSNDKIHLMRPDGRRLAITRAQLTKEDIAWMKFKDADGEERVHIDKRRIIQGPDTAKGASEVDIEKNALTVVRYWTMEEYVGRLGGVSQRILHLITEDGRRKEIPVMELTGDDRMWLNVNVSPRMRRILSGKAVQE